MSDLERRLRAFVSTGSGLDRRRVIPGNDNGPTPGDPFASVTLIDDQTIGEPAEANRLDGDSVRADLLVVHRAVYRVQFYRRGANETAQRFTDWLDSPLAKLEEDKSLSEFNGARFRVVNPITSRNVAEIIPDEFEERISIDLTIDYAQPFSQDVGRVEKIPLDVGADSFVVES